MKIGELTWINCESCTFFKGKCTYYITSKDLIIDGDEILCNAYHKRKFDPNLKLREIFDKDFTLFDPVSEQPIDVKIHCIFSDGTVSVIKPDSPFPDECRHWIDELQEKNANNKG